MTGQLPVDPDLGSS